MNPEFNFTELFTQGREPNRDFEGAEFPLKITFDQRSSSEYTLLDIQALDRPGLLYHVAETLAHSKADIAYARITTEKGAALDTFYITDQDGNKVVSDEWQDQIAKDLRAAIGI